MNFIMYILIIAEIILIGIKYKRCRTIFNPSIIFGVYYLLQIIVGIFVFDKKDFTFYGLCWLMCALIIFYIGSAYDDIFKNNGSKVSNEREYAIKVKISVIIVVVTTIIAIVTFIMVLISKNISISRIFKIDYWLKVNSKLAAERYNGNSIIKSSILGEIMLICAYFSPLISGFNFNFYRKKKTKVLSLISLIPSFLIVAIQNTKSTWIAGCLLFLSGYIVSNIIIKGGVKKFSVKKSICILTSMIIFIGINYASMMVRIGRMSIKTISIVNKKIIIYALGHVPVFDIWFSKNILDCNYKLGVRTFYGISNFLGIDKRIQGIYNEYAIFSLGSSNIYTMFRPYLEDFGVVIGLIIFFILGILFEHIFNKIRCKIISRFEVMLLASFYFYILYGFITSAWAYMNFIAVFILFLIYLFVVLRRNYLEKENKC